jgi:hypothetical protein
MLHMVNHVCTITAPLKKALCLVLKAPVTFRLYSNQYGEPDRTVCLNLLYSSATTSIDDKQSMYAVCDCPTGFKATGFTLVGRCGPMMHVCIVHNALAV